MAEILSVPEIDPSPLDVDEITEAVDAEILSLQTGMKQKEHESGWVLDGMTIREIDEMVETEVKKIVWPEDSSDIVSIYLNEMGATPLLTKDEEVVLAQALESGNDVKKQVELGVPKNRQMRRAIKQGELAKGRMIRSNLRLVVAVAKRYPVPRGMEFLDLVQEGNLGLEHAVDKFEWRKGFKFSTYAMFWIRQAVGRSIDVKGNVIKLPVGKAVQLRTALRAVDFDEDRLDDEMKRLYLETTPTSLDRTFEDSHSTLKDLIPDLTVNVEQSTIDSLDVIALKDRIERLADMQHIAVTRRLGLHDKRKWTYREIGDELGVSHEAARGHYLKGVKILQEVSADPESPNLA